MNRRTIRSAAACAVAAWTLLASTLAPPPIVHVHSGGRRPHHHDHAAAAPDGATLVVVSASGACHDEVGISAAVAERHEHFHLALLGAIEYAPRSGERDSHRGGSSLGWEPAALAIAPASGVRAVGHGAPAVHGDTLVLGGHLDSCVYLPESRALVRRAAAPRVLLCDRARQERSGVLLA